MMLVPSYARHRSPLAGQPALLVQTLPARAAAQVLRAAAQVLRLLRGLRAAAQVLRAAAQVLRAAG